MTNIRELMNPEVITCAPGDSLDTAARAMWEGDIGCLPIVDEDRRVIGIITDRDACMAAYTRGQRLADIPIREVMSRNVVTCSPDEDLGAVEWRMAVAQVHRLPVVDATGHLLGIVSMNDLARSASDLHEEARIVETLAHVSAPRHAGLTRSVS